MTDVELVGVEAGGRSAKPGDHAVAAQSYGQPGVLHGSFSYVMQDDDGQTCDVHSISAGLDYPGVGPEHSYWKDAGRVQLHVAAATTTRWRPSTRWPAAKASCRRLESSHAVAKAMELAAGASPRTKSIVVCLSGRGDKDAAEIARLTRSARVSPETSVHRLAPLHSHRRTLSTKLRARRAQGPDAVRHGRRSRPGVHRRRAAASWSAAAAHLCEVGIPYSDPIADGPVIQASYTRALAQQGQAGRDPGDARRRLRRSVAAPLVTMVSYAIVYRHGLAKYVAEAQAAGIAGAIVPDLPVEEAGAARRRSAASGDFSLIQLVTPTTPRERAVRIAETSTGFLYYVSVAGITGERTELPPELVDNVGWLRDADRAADLHRLRHQPAGARAEARPRGRRPDRRLGHRAARGRNRPKASSGSSRTSCCRCAQPGRCARYLESGRLGPIAGRCPAPRPLLERFEMLAGRLFVEFQPGFFGRFCNLTHQTLPRYDLAREVAAAPMV